jgi:hypothetical protein
VEEFLKDFENADQALVKLQDNYRLNSTSLTINTCTANINLWNQG